ncbi:MAG: hypothetical protein K1Y36_06885 [Blastocatellia bacterium]|nr:hypothetical protein [Blastocatellia bacterium]
MNNPNIQKDTGAWIAQVWISFILAAGFTCWGIYHLPIDQWMRGYLAMGFFFSLGSAFTLAKTLRDNHEAGKIINRISDAKTEKILSEFEMREKNVANFR